MYAVHHLLPSLLESPSTYEQLAPSSTVTYLQSSHFVTTIVFSSCSKCRLGSGWDCLYLDKRDMLLLYPHLRTPCSRQTYGVSFHTQGTDQQRTLLWSHTLDNVFVLTSFLSPSCLNLPIKSPCSRACTVYRDCTPSFP